MVLFFKLNLVVVVKLKLLIVVLGEIVVLIDVKKGFFRS